MGQIFIGNRNVEDLSDEDMIAWIADMNEGYRIRDDTIKLWVAIMRVFDDVGTPVTVRQMFYRLVSEGAIGKSESEYKKVAKQLVRMRKTGVVPYSFIADNTRWMRRPKTYDSVDSMLESAAASYRRSLWTNQKNYVEIWMEKDALAGVFVDVTNEYDVPLMVSHGFSSVTYLYHGSEVIKQNTEAGRDCYIFNFGDHDPSGVNVSESIERGLREFGAHFEYARVAVTPEQIQSMNLLTRPTKTTDSRSKNFEGESVELDAIHPTVLKQMVRDTIERLIDKRQLEAVRQAEEFERESLLVAVEGGYFGGK